MAMMFPPEGEILGGGLMVIGGVLSMFAKSPPDPNIARFKKLNDKLDGISNHLNFIDHKMNVLNYKLNVLSEDVNAI